MRVFVVPFSHLQGANALPGVEGTEIKEGDAAHTKHLPREAGTASVSHDQGLTCGHVG